MWEVVERCLKVAGIVGGLAAAVGVWIQLKDLNTKQQQKAVEDWQSAIVYDIIEKNNSPTLDEISQKYVTAAQKQSLDIPREKLDDLQLRLVLENLMGKNVIVQGSDLRFSVLYGEKGVYGLEYQNLIARQIRIAREVLTDAKTPISYDVLKRKMIEDGGDKQFLKDNYDAFLQTLQNYGVAWTQDDGKVALIPNLQQQSVQRSEK